MGRPPSKVLKKDQKQCNMHLMSIKKEEAKDFTRKQWIHSEMASNSCLACRVRIRGERKHTNIVQKLSLTMGFKEWLSLHLGITPLATGISQTKSTWMRPRNGSHCSEGQDAPGQQQLNKCPRKKPRSRMGLSVPAAGTVLPALCIICKETEKESTTLWQAKAKRTISHRHKRCQQVGKQTKTNYTHTHTQLHNVFNIYCCLLFIVSESDKLCFADSYKYIQIYNKV